MSPNGSLPIHPREPRGRVPLVTVFDTSICDNNLGNHIIMDGVRAAIDDAFDQPMIVRVPYLEGIGRHCQSYLGRSDFTFFGGGNCISGTMETNSQWGLGLLNSLRIPRFVLLGVGWWQYQAGVSFYSRLVLSRMLHRTALHAVRDNYTAHKLRALGFENVLNTGCPSLWKLTEKHCESIATEPAREVVFTLTCYRKDAARDRQMFDALRKQYMRLSMWVQSPEDLTYARSIGIEGVEQVGPSLEALDRFLAERRADYVGTRLHAGIRAMQFKRRTLIIGVDNRATEMGKDFGLPVLDRSKLGELQAWTRTPSETRLSLPWETIALWKSQFRAGAGRAAA